MAGVGRKIKRKIKGVGEGHVELDLLTINRPIAHCRLVWKWMDAAGLDRIVRSKGTQVLSLESEIAVGCAATVQLHIRWRIDPRRDLRCRESRWPARPANVREIREYLVNLDNDLANRRSDAGSGGCHQAGERRARNEGWRSDSKIVRRLDLELAGGRRTRRSRDLSVRIAGGERERVGGCRHR